MQHKALIMVFLQFETAQINNTFKCTSCWHFIEGMLNICNVALVHYTRDNTNLNQAHVMCILFTFFIHRKTGSYIV